LQCVGFDPYPAWVGSIGRPHIPSPTLIDIGQGRPRRFGRVAILERRDGTVWIEVGRYGSVRDADVALDEAVGAGVEPDSMRVVETHASAATTRVLVIVGALGLVGAIGIILLYAVLH
jgi:hypothetical protein